LFLAIVAILAVSGIALAVGFDKIDILGDKPLKIAKVVNNSSSQSHAGAEFRLAERYPQIIDEAIEMIKDFLGQFGIVNRTKQ
jgi:hypothetical protein